MLHARLSRGYLAALVLGTFTAATSPAQTTFTWDGSAGQLFSEPDNWVGNTAPSTDGSATIVIPLAHDLDLQLPSAQTKVHAFNPDHTGGGDLYVFGDASELWIGAGGINLAGTSGFTHIGVATTIGANQTWGTPGDSIIQIAAGLAGASDLTKVGTGWLWLNSSSTYTGDLSISEGRLLVGDSGATGTGALTLHDNTSIGTFFPESTLNNASISLGNDVTFGWSYDTELTITGDVTARQASTRVLLAPETDVYFAGSIGDAVDLATTYTFANEGVAILSGVNTYSGGTVVDGAAVIFANIDALPDDGSIAVLDGGYVGAAFNGGAAAILGKVADPALFAGAIGFDSDEDAVPLVFNDALDLTGFTSEQFLGLGSGSHAIYNGVLTVADGSSYRFGGGGGTLYVGSDLNNATTTGVSVKSDPLDPLTVVLRGTNTFGGDLTVDGSVVILDSVDALPSESGIILGADAYIGYTGEYPAESFATFAGLVGGSTPTSILGIDTFNSEAPIASAANIDLSGFGEVYFGTATALEVTGLLTAPEDGVLRLAGVKGGQLNIAAAMDATSVVIGSPNPALSEGGLVRLGTANPYSDGTTLLNGALVVGHGQALGTGPLTIAHNSFGEPLILTSDPGTPITLGNAISAAVEGSRLQIGIPETSNPQDSAYRLQAYAGNPDEPHDLKLTGQISGPLGLDVLGNVILTLSNALNDFTGGLSLYGPSHVIAEANAALGLGPLELGPGTDVVFTSAATAPTIYNVSDGFMFDGVIDNDSYIQLPAEATSLTLHQTLDETLAAHIGGAPPNSLVGIGRPASVGAKLVKTGAGTLTLSNSNSFTGLELQQGTLIALHGDALGDPFGTITVNPGTTLAVYGTNADYSLLFNGGRLEGNGSFSGNPSVGAGATLAPGFDSFAGSDAVGSMQFVELTLAGGGTLEWNLTSLGGEAGAQWDVVSVTSANTLTIDATTMEIPFNLKLSTVDPTGNLAVLNGFTEGTVYSWELFKTQGIELPAEVELSTLFSIDASDFQTDIGGEFWVSVNPVGDGFEDLVLNFSPVPEPSTYALMAVGLGLMGARAWRCRRRR